MAEPSGFVKAYIARKERERQEARDDKQRQEDYAFRQQMVDLSTRQTAEAERAAKAQELFRQDEANLRAKEAQESARRNVEGLLGQGLIVRGTEGQEGMSDLGGGIFGRATTPEEQSKRKLDIELTTRRALLDTKKKELDDFLTVHGPGLDEQTKQILTAATFGYELPQATIPNLLATGFRDTGSLDPVAKQRGNALLSLLLRFQQAGSYGMSPTAAFNLSAENLASQFLRQASQVLGSSATHAALVNKAIEIASQSNRPDAVQALSNLRQGVGAGDLTVKQRLENVLLTPIVEAMERGQAAQTGVGGSTRVPPPSPPPPASPTAPSAQVAPAQEPTGVDPFDVLRIFFTAPWQQKRAR